MSSVGAQVLHALQPALIFVATLATTQSTVLQRVVRRLRGGRIHLDDLPPDSLPQPVVVAQHERRHTSLVVLALLVAVTYLVSGAVVAAAAAAPPHVWLPAFPGWAWLPVQILGGILAWALVAIAYLVDAQRSESNNAWRVRASWTAALGALTDVGLLVVYSQSLLCLWMLPAIGLAVVRLVLYGALVFVSRYDRIQFVQELPQEAGSSAEAAHEANARMGVQPRVAPPSTSFAMLIRRIKILAPYLWPHKSVRLQALAVTCLLLLASARVVNLLVPIALGRVVEALGSGTAPWVPIFVYCGLKLFQGSGGLLTVVQNWLWYPVAWYSDVTMSMHMFEHILNLSMSYHTKRKTGELIRTLDRGAAINSFFEFFLFSLVPVFVDIFVAVGYLSWTFGPLVGSQLLVVMVLFTYCSVRITTWRTQLRRDANNADTVCRAITTDTVLNYETVKCYSNEPYEAGRYRVALDACRAAGYRVVFSLHLLNLIQNLILAFGTLSSVLTVAYTVVHGTATSSQFVVFVSYLQQVYQPLSMLGTMYRVINQNLVDTDKLMELLEEQVDIRDDPHAVDLSVPHGTLDFQGVSFAYDTGKLDIIKDMSFHVDGHRRVALVGESGAGKSTVFKLLYRFYDVDAGTVAIDGQDIRSVTQQSLRKAIGIVPQEPSLFNTDIRHNILYGNVHATDEEVENAARAAQIHDRIMEFPDGYATVVGERGVRLSGGEKQRVAIARTILKNPPILLLDEATSALDSYTERQLQAALSTLMQGRTTLTIAHRLSTIINSDLILVADKGRIVERGTHEELLAEKGLYHRLWIQQSRTLAEQEAEASSGQQPAPAHDSAQPPSGRAKGKGAQK